MQRWGKPALPVAGDITDGNWMNKAVSNIQALYEGIIWYADPAQLLADLPLRSIFGLIVDISILLEDGSISSFVRKWFSGGGR